MSTTSRPFRPSVDIHTDDSFGPDYSSSGNRFPILDDLPLTNIQNFKPPTLDTLTRQLSNLHIHNSACKENEFVQQQGTREQERRVRLSSSSFNGVFSSNSTRTNELALASHNLPDNQVQLVKHQEGQFEWLLSLPIKIAKSAAKGRRSLAKSRDDDDQQSQGEKQLLFGCNLVRHRAPPNNGEDKRVNIYTLLATRIEHEEEDPLTKEPEGMEDTLSVAANTSHVTSTLNNPWDQVMPSTESMDGQRLSETLATMSFDNKENHNFADEQHFERHLSVSPQPVHARPLSRIEDSVEELDQLHEQLEEAREEVAQLERVISPEIHDDDPTEIITELPPPPVLKPTPVKRASSVRGAPTTSTLRTRNTTTATAERASSVRRSLILSSRDDDDGKASSSASSKVPSSKATPTTTRKTVSRPTSLLPPKATTKSSKTPTVAAFELPGEAIARRLKEQRVARHSQSLSQDHQQPLNLSSSKSATSPSKTAPIVKSSKPLTRSAFELPGEAISRRKREEREAKLRQMKEEEKKRRAFRARPMPSSVKTSGVGGLNRETAASQARRAEVSPLRAKRESLIGSSGAAAGTGSPRASMTVTTTMTTRGRVSAAAGAGGGNRGTSSASGSSIVGALKSQVGSVKGKEVFKRESEYTSERERERKEREEAAKAARQEAAERSKALGREWKEKQMMRERKRMSLIGGSTA
ncbi:hypothetical protein QBC43DRAFT_313910 [Cladorrhinum sp. PSN259]|nr:hypothetical protein QBC43DRAFT_313910 [Cladorrhinum sp. PSN259]